MECANDPATPWIGILLSAWGFRLFLGVPEDYGFRPEHALALVDRSPDLLFGPRLLVWMSPLDVTAQMHGYPRGVAITEAVAALTCGVALAR